MISITFLGTGTSTGVPVVGCTCDVCTSSDPRDNRLRCSIVVREGDVTVLVDTTPDLRFQLLRDPVPRLDAVLFTHSHADHTAGLDELRRYNAMQQEHLSVWANGTTLVDLTRRFDYVFTDRYPVYGVIPDLHLRAVDGVFHIREMRVTPVPVMHGRLPILGYRFGRIAYLTDVKSIPASSMPLLEDLDVLVLTALRRDPHPAHLSLDEALALVETIQPRHALFTHIAHDMGKYEDVAPILPPHVQLATDGMQVVTGDEAGGVSIRPAMTPVEQDL